MLRVLLLKTDVTTSYYNIPLLSFCLYLLKIGKGIYLDIHKYIEYSYPYFL